MQGYRNPFSAKGIIRKDTDLCGYTDITLMRLRNGEDLINRILSIHPDNDTGHELAADKPAEGPAGNNPQYFRNQ